MLHVPTWRYDLWRAYRSSLLISLTFNSHIYYCHIRFLAKRFCPYFRWSVEEAWARERQREKAFQSCMRWKQKNPMTWLAPMGRLFYSFPSHAFSYSYPFFFPVLSFMFDSFLFSTFFLFFIPDMSFSLTVFLSLQHVYPSFQLIPFTSRINPPTRTHLSAKRTQSYPHALFYFMQELWFQLYLITFAQPR